MARVLFSITEAQLACLVQLQAGGAPSDVDKRTLAGLRKRGLIEASAEGREAVTAQGTAVLALCEKLAITGGTVQRRRKP